MQKNGLIYFLLLWIVSNCSVSCSCGKHIPHGDVNWCLAEDTICVYSCNEGYKKDDTVSWLRCSTSGQWVSGFPLRQVSAKDLCAPKPCPTLISKGAFSAACNAVVGSTCSFSCEAGYMWNISASWVTCQASTEWSADLTSLCLRPDGQQCPYYIPRGHLNLTCIREPGQTCSFTCDDLYLPSISPPMIACGSELVWDYYPPRLCQEINCDTFFEGGYVQFACSKKYNATCSEYRCSYGYVKRSKYSYLKCDKSGNWIIPDLKSSPCVRCDTQISHGHVIGCNELDTPCSYFCQEGYKEDDKVRFLVCTTSGQMVSWLTNSLVSAKDLCTPKPCPIVISKGAFSAECEGVVGSTCSFSCEEGYMRNTSVSELTCQTSTEWSQDLRSLCLRPDGQQCPYYIPRGDLNPTCIREPGHTCSFTCDDGYQPSISPPTIACGSDLEWNHNPESLCQGEGSGNRNIGPTVGIIIGTLLAGIIFFALCIGLIAKCCGARKSQRRGSGHVWSRCLRPSGNPVQNVTTIRQQPNANGIVSVSSFESPSYNGFYVHPYVQQISTISNSCKYHGPPPSYSSIPPKESPPTYEEVVTDPSRFNLYITHYKVSATE